MRRTKEIYLGLHLLPTVGGGVVTLDTVGRLCLSKKCKTFIVTNESARQYLSSATGESGNSFKNNLILLSLISFTNWVKI